LTKRLVFFLGPALICILCPSVGYAIDAAEVLQHGEFVFEECQTLTDTREFTPASNIPLSAYGGWRENRATATGFFHAAKVNGRWWVIDPEGCLFLSIGVNSVSPPPSLSSKGDRFTRDLDLEWGEEAFRQLRGHGFNTLGCWSTAKIATHVSRPMPYCLRWNFMAAYRRQRASHNPAAETFSGIYPFDPEFPDFCDRVARTLENTNNDPWLFGHFSDNELPLHEKGIVTQYLSQPPSDPNHKAAATFMALRRRSTPTADDDRDFLRLVVDTYYRTVASAIRKHDPNHMFLGSRFHGRALSSPVIFEAAGEYADVLSVNYYHRWTPENNRIEEWARLAGKPILITEWYAMAIDSGLPTEGLGAGFVVKGQRDRARFYQHFALTLLRNPACVGWHWFRYRDGRNNAGLVNADEDPYAEIWEAAKEVNDQAYPLATFLQKQR
jgi:hypothetical protein